MAHTVTYDQYAAGGAISAIHNVSGFNPTTYNQYAAGGAAAQLRASVSGCPVFDQRAAGGVAEQIRVATAALP